MVTASFTDTGSPAYLTSDGSWSPNLSDALAIESEQECAERLKAAHAQQRLVCDPYSIPVVQRAQRLEPLSQREAIRATGPSVATQPLRRSHDDNRSHTGGPAALL